MSTPLKSKPDWRQSVARLLVIDGSTLVFGSFLILVFCVGTNVEPRHPDGLVWALVVGLLLWLVGKGMAPKVEVPAAVAEGSPEVNPRDVTTSSLFWAFIIVVILLILASILFPTIDKPVIYLYPPQPEEVAVRLDYAGKITADYPAMDPALGGWNVMAYPDGHLLDQRDGREYSYLYWEGEGRMDRDWSTGFVVKGADTRQFLQDTLPKLGLTPREYNEFIVYWYPKMKDHPLNLVHFAGREYTDTAKLTVTPRPDTVIRVFMVWKPISGTVSVPAQTFPPVERHGFTVVEWGGTEAR